eukprot:scaffold328_cov248-Pinguiococcus_pyrenoidosus.AAC.10
MTPPTLICTREERGFHGSVPLFPCFQRGGLSPSEYSAAETSWYTRWGTYGGGGVSARALVYARNAKVERAKIPPLT